MKRIRRGGHCDYDCCSHDGSCSSSLSYYTPTSGGGHTNESSQSAGLDTGLQSNCGAGEYLGALYFSGPSH